MLALTSPEQPDAWKDDLPAALIAKIREQGTTVIAVSSEPSVTKNLLLAEGHTAARVMRHVIEGVRSMVV